MELHFLVYILAILACCAFVTVTTLQVLQHFVTLSHKLFMNLLQMNSVDYWEKVRLAKSSTAKIWNGKECLRTILISLI